MMIPTRLLTASTGRTPSCSGRWRTGQEGVERRCWGGEMTRPPAPPELEEPALRAQARLQGEIMRLRRQGIPAEHTWSAALVPTIWLSLPVYCHRLLLPALVREAVDLRPARRLTSFWQGQGVQPPCDLIAWLHGREDMGQHSEFPPAFGYFAAAAQERMLALARVDQQLHLALCNAIRCPIAAAEAPAPAGALGGERERCAVCLEDLPGDAGGAAWPGGCGRNFHQHCMMGLLRWPGAGALPPVWHRSAGLAEARGLLARPLRHLHLRLPSQ